MSVEHIVLASDLSCRCDRALDRAADLAGRWNAQLHIVTAVDHDYHMPSWRSHTRVLETARAEIAVQLSDKDIEWDLTVETGAPAEAVERAAARSGAQLIVTGVARNELLGRTTPGRTVETLLRRLPAPVLTVRRPFGGPYRRILHPTDLTPGSVQAAQRTLAWFPDAQLNILRAYRAPFSGFLSEDAHWRECREDAFQQTGAYMERLRAVVGDVDLPPPLVEYGDVESLVYDFVDARGADLVVVASHLQNGALPFGGSGHTLSILMASAADVLVAPEAAIVRIEARTAPA